MSDWQPIKTALNNVPVRLRRPLTFDKTFNSRDWHLEIQDKYPERCWPITSWIFAEGYTPENNQTGTYGTKLWFDLRGRELVFVPTEWMPLPEPPK